MSVYRYITTTEVWQRLCYLSVDRRFIIIIIIIIIALDNAPYKMLHKLKSACFIWSRTGTLSLTGTGMERLQLELNKNPNLLKATRRQVEEELEAALEKRGINRVKPWSLRLFICYINFSTFF